MEAEREHKRELELQQQREVAAAAQAQQRDAAAARTAMHSRAACIITAYWRGYKARQLAKGAKTAAKKGKGKK